MIRDHLPEKRAASIATRIKASAKDALDKMLEQDGLTLADWIEAAIAEYELERAKKKP